MNKPSLLLTLVLSLTCSFANGQDHWPQFRGADQSGVAESSYPSKWSETENIQWKVKIEGIAWSQPIVWGDEIFLTTAVAKDQPDPIDNDRGPGFSLFSAEGLNRVKDGGTPANTTVTWKLICIDLGTGERKWEKTVHSGPPPIAIHRSNSYASETPATDGKRIYVQVAMKGLWCFDMNGEELWKYDLPSQPIQFGWGGGSSALLAGDSIYLQSDNEKQSFLVALDKQSGEERWKVERDELSSWSTPYLWHNRQREELVVCGGRATTSYDPESGKTLWTFPANGRTATTAVGNDDLVFIASVSRSHGKSGPLAAIQAGSSGELTSESEHVAWSQKKSAPELASPLLFGDSLYTLSQLTGAIRCFDVATGETRYRERLPGAGTFTASPWTDGKNIYCLNGNGKTYAVAGGSEFKLLATNSLDGMFWSSAAVTKDRLLLRSVDHLYCVAAP